VTTYGAAIEVEGEIVYAFPRPETLIAAGIDELRRLKLSGRKAEYLIGAAERNLDGTIVYENLNALDNEEAIAILSSIRGVGRWTAQWVLMRALGGRDVLPAGDLALQRMIGDLYFDGRRLSEGELDRFAEERWTPYRGLTTTYLFAHLRRQRALGDGI
jgi:3-methyladenine DNA glycosylase/8-oxoguanine DNA glycosylase